MIFKVYHADHPTFGLGKVQEFPKDFTHVANVDTNNLSDVFRLTNHIDGAWWENEGVEFIQQSRSTSVGDVVEHDGKFYRCEIFGWTEFTNN